MENLRKASEFLFKENRLLNARIEELESNLELAKEKLEMLEKLNKEYLANYKQNLEDCEYRLEMYPIEEGEVFEYVKLVKELTQELDDTMYKVLYE